ncbi:hypothetical protein IE81DRAFT_320724 [Ceraceosorus guamensis]|uniref:Sensitive to high expression protein 9, mitochondrial n=1 Tax=Ceraceosorus guamensis TaxID=1522189 RepID=A0A316W5T5_9BASI|nr:hypothetical protein IE81DRAFT_320724 [Ceraceosorus guamensis]PWN45112.1 hypothetical protein IE81DRAFT_320724 [Ceraceosorus guamensis]
MLIRPVALARSLGARSCAPSSSSSSSSKSVSCNDSAQLRSYSHSAPGPSSSQIDSSKRQATGSAAQKLKIPPRLQARLDELGPRILERMRVLSGRWNEVSGYEAVEALKKDVELAEQRLVSLKAQQNEALQAHRKAVAQRSETQRTLNDLLSRKSSWSNSDLASYTALLQSEHSESAMEKEAGDKYEVAERQRERAWDDVVRKTLERFHEEWRWSERGRTLGNWVSAGVVGLNVVLFITAILIVEPYKRRKLAQTFEARLLQGEAANSARIESLLAGVSERLTSMETSTRGTQATLQDLAVVAGLGRGAHETLENGQAPVPTDAEVPAHPALTPLQKEIRDKQAHKERQRDLALAGTVGFAVGAGLLAIVSAAWSG